MCASHARVFVCVCVCERERERERFILMSELLGDGVVKGVVLFGELGRMSFSIRWTKDQVQISTSRAVKSRGMPFPPC